MNIFNKLACKITKQRICPCVGNTNESTITYNTPTHQSISNQTSNSERKSVKMNLFNEPKTVDNPIVPVEESIDISKLPLLITSPEINRQNKFQFISPISITSNMNGTVSLYDSDIQEDHDELTNSAFTNELYDSPRLNRTENLFKDSSLGYNSSDFQSAHSSYFNRSDSSSTLSTTSSFNQTSDVYVCSFSYSAKDNTELSIYNSECFNILHQKDDLMLVINVNDKSKFGYVPKSCLTRILNK